LNGGGKADCARGSKGKGYQQKDSSRKVGSRSPEGRMETGYVCRDSPRGSSMSGRGWVRSVAGGLAKGQVQLDSGSGSWERAEFNEGDVKKA